MRRALYGLGRYPLRLMRDTYRYLSFGFSEKRGVYRTFREAEAAAPRKSLGYNHRDLALAYQSELNLRLDSSDYPVLFHLKHILTKPCTVLDMGGNVGTHYLRYRECLNMVDVRWIVCDVPEITKVGREICAGMSNIEFVHDMAELGSTHIDVFLASDSLQYIDGESPAVLLRQLIDRCGRPAHILLDLLPLYEGERFVTLQNGGPVYYPQHVFNRSDLIESITDLGFVLADIWDDHHDSCVIPFHPDKSVYAYTGLHFVETNK